MEEALLGLKSGILSGQLSQAGLIPLIFAAFLQFSQNL